MAITWQGIVSDPLENLQTEIATVIDGVEETGDGEWFDTGDTVSLTIEISGITTGGVTLSISNAAAKPLDTTHGIDFTSEYTADDFVKIDRKDIHRWFKVRVSSWTEGVISVIVKRIRQSYS